MGEESVDEESFRRHFEENFAAVWRYARRRTGSATDADDIAAETFAVAWRRRNELPEPGARLWLFVVARNVLLNHARSAQRRDRLYLRLAHAPGDLAVPGPGDSDGRVWTALAVLSAEDRDLLVMRAWDELGIAEMAGVLGCTPNAVSIRLNRARSRLAAELRRIEGEARAPDLAMRIIPAQEEL